MGKKLIKKVASTVTAFVLSFEVLSTSTGKNSLFGSFFSADAATSTVAFDSKTGILTLSGNVINKDVQRWSSNSDVKKVICAKDTLFPENCKDMFSNYRAEEIDLSNANTSNVTDMSFMFEFCNAKSIDIKSFDTSNVTTMRGMFQSCYVESLDVSGFNTSKVTDMCAMFNSCSVKSLDLSSFDTLNVTDMRAMFFSASSLKSLAACSLTAFAFIVTSLYIDNVLLQQFLCRSSVVVSTVDVIVSKAFSFVNCYFESFLFLIQQFSVLNYLCVKVCVFKIYVFYCELLWVK